MFLNIRNTRFNQKSPVYLNPEGKKKIPHKGDKASLDQCGLAPIPKKILLVRQNSPKKKKKERNCCVAILHPLWEKVLQSETSFPLLFPKYSKYLKSLDIRLWELGAQTFKRSYHMKSNPKNKLLRRFYTLYEQKFANMRQLLLITFLQGFRISKKFLHWTLGNGCKKTVKHSENRQTNKQIDKHIDILTYDTVWDWMQVWRTQRY